VISENLTVSTADRVAIEAAALDYIEGWYEGDPARTARCLHPAMAKRLVAPPRDAAPGAPNTIHELDTATLIGYVHDRAGQAPPAAQRKGIEILSVYGDIASVRAEMNDWVDMLHLGKLGGEWKIINVLWALRPKWGTA
jgi:hypothetical protein